MDAIEFGVAPKVIRRAGQVNTAMSDGHWVTRSEKVFVPGVGLVKTAPYDNHFVYIDNLRKKGWLTFCTCGGPAVVAGYDAYKQDASSQGSLLLCHVHATTGKHADGSS